MRRKVELRERQRQNVTEPNKLVDILSIKKKESSNNIYYVKYYLKKTMLCYLNYTSQMLTAKQEQILSDPIKITRHFNKWSMNEINRLHNEYEIKELTIRQIAKLHGRTYLSILHKLTSEGLIDENWESARGFYETTD